MILAFAIAGAATVFFCVRALQVQRDIATMTITDVFAAETARENRRNLRERFIAFVDRAGYHGPLAPIFLAFAVLYLLLTLLFVVFGLPQVAGVVLGAPAALAVSWLAVISVRARRQARFEAQLVQLFTMLAARLETGAGLRQAMEQVADVVGDPLRTELRAALARQVATRDVVGPIRDLARSWPSRAMDMFIAALSLNALAPAGLAPSLRRAAETLDRNFEIVSEAKAEIAQTRMEFFIVAGVVAAIALFMIFGGGAGRAGAYASLGGAAALTVAAANYVVGCLRAARIFTRVRREL